MRIYFDTSSLLKLYHKEAGTDELNRLLNNNSVEIICLSEITEIEFPSALWKKVRTGEAGEKKIKEVLQNFISDYQKFLFIGLDKEIKLRSVYLLEKYRNQGIKTLDSIQLSSAIQAKELDFADHFECADKLLLNLMKLEGLIS